LLLVSPSPEGRRFFSPFFLTLRGGGSGLGVRRCAEGLARFANDLRFAVARRAALFSLPLV
ncbi:MAG TPA: hypothetical protein VGQ80_18520, partial [Acidimicrobiia bacterium]|nr:hypothetical protein [Acidimicrobiia bacterium]